MANQTTIWRRRWSEHGQGRNDLPCLVPQRAKAAPSALQTPPPPAGDKSTRKVSKRKRRREAVSKRSKRIAMILLGVVMALLAVAQHFGWIAGPPPLLAPGIQ